MRYLSFSLFFLTTCFLLNGCNYKNDVYKTLSPNGKLEISLFLSKDGKAGYLINFQNKRVINTSYFGFDFKDQSLFGKNLGLTNSATSTYDNTWENSLGRAKICQG